MTLEMEPFVQILGQMLSPSPGHRLWFLYDLLLDEARLRSRVQRAARFHRGRITNWRCVVNRAGVITLKPCLGHVVHGVIWEISDDDFRKLDQQFVVLGRTECRGAFAWSKWGELMPVEFYRALDSKDGRVDVITHLRMLALAREYRFPRDYIDEVERWPTLPLNGDPPDGP